MDRPLATARGRKPQHQKKQRQKLKSAASAANRLVTKPQSRKDRKTALAAAARLFELAERNGTKIEFVGAEESDGDDIGMEEAMAERGFVARDASPDAWAAFWRSKPAVVAIDAEGTHLEPPLLVQVACDTSKDVLIVQPSDSVGPDLARLLQDDSIKKCFFGAPKNERLGCMLRNVVDVQRAAGPGEGGRSRGLAEVCGEFVRGAPYAKDKRLQKSFGFVRDRNWRPSPEQRAYAAADAWATLEVWRRLPRKRSRGGSGGGGGGARKRRKSGDGGAALDIEIRFE